MLEAAFAKSLPDFTLEVDFVLRGGTMVIFGPSGSGKTTLLRCLAGLASPDNGDIVLNGSVFYSSGLKKNVAPRVRNIGYVFQEYALFPHMTVKQNALYGVKGCKGKDHRYRMSVLDVLEMLKITHLQDRYPAQLSGGERQRVAMARALMTEPQLILLDEPFAALDVGTKRQLRRELKTLQDRWQIPFILVTHSKNDLRELGDQALFLNNGRQCQVLKNHYAETNI